MQVVAWWSSSNPLHRLWGLEKQHGRSTSHPVPVPSPSRPGLSQDVQPQGLEPGRHHAWSHHLPSLHDLQADSPKCHPAYACPPPWEQCPGKTLFISPTSCYFGAPVYGHPPGLAHNLLKTHHTCPNHPPFACHIMSPPHHDAEKSWGPRGVPQGGFHQLQSSLFRPSPQPWGSNCMPVMLAMQPQTESLHSLGIAGMLKCTIPCLQPPCFRSCVFFFFKKRYTLNCMLGNIHGPAMGTFVVHS